jgi:hypothetical protein
VTALLDSPGYADHWTAYWDDVLLGDKIDKRFVDRERKFDDWLRSEFRQRAWNAIVYELLAAKGVDRGSSDVSEVSGAANWLLKYQNNPSDLAGTASATFLGVKIQCAQCHDHKTESGHNKISALCSLFFHRQGERKKRRVCRDREGKDRRRSTAPTFPAPRTAAKRSPDGSRRRKGPWFARAIVNRMWGYFLRRAGSSSRSTTSASRPPTLPDLLDELAKAFASGGYDLKHLHSDHHQHEAYQLSSEASFVPSGSRRSGPLPPLKPLGPTSCSIRCRRRRSRRPARRQERG